jgi:aminoglycoside 6'-N-acetyltransferase I
MDQATFVLERPGGALGGFAEASLRTCAEGCTTTPVGFLEGLYLDPDLRGAKLARGLVDAAESWAREQGCSEMGSDITPENHHSYRVHLALGYAEVERLICFRKAL